MADQSHAVVYLTEFPPPELVTALMAPFEGSTNHEHAQHFDRICGDGLDTGPTHTSWLANSGSAWEPDVFAISGRRVTLAAMHDHLAGLPWGHHGAIAIMDGDHESKTQVKVYGRLAR